MPNSDVSDENKVQHGDRTDWKKVIHQSDSQIEQKASTDPDSPVLKNKKYYKPGKGANK